MQATVVIISKNRRDDLRKAVQSAVDQTANPQVLVIDDGSTDGSSEMILTEFRQVALHRDEQSQGYIVQRNRAAELATSDVIFSIDDDAAFSTPHVVEQTLLDFNHPRIGAVAIPFINVNSGTEVFKRSPSETEILVGFDFIGTAHAVRRDLFQKLKGYRPFLIHQGEEQDFCARMLQVGHVVRLGRADPIHHFESPNRNLKRLDLFGRRTDILFVWYNTPMRFLPLQLLGTTVRGVIMGIKLRRPFRMIHGLTLGYLAILHEWSFRNPVSVETFRLIRRLKRKPALLADIENDLPPL